MRRPYRLLMVTVDHQALEVLPPEVEVTVLLSGGVKDIGLPVPHGVRTVFVDEAKNVDASLNALFRDNLTEFDAVYAHDDPALMTAAAIASVLGARAVPAPVVALFRDKYLQKQRLRQAGVDVARHVLVDDIRDIPPGWRMPFERAVLKPVAGQATASTYAVGDTADVLRISRDCRNRNVAARTFVVEEFVDGQEWFADGVMSGGRLCFASLGRYPRNCLTAVREQSPVRTHCLDPVADKAAYDLAMPVVERALSTLGLDDGVFHMELFHSNGSVVFSECAARRAGGPIRDQVRYKFGVDLAYHSVMSLLEPVDRLDNRPREGAVAASFLPLVPGTLLDHPSEAELRGRPGVVGARIFVPRGLRVPQSTASTFGRMGEFTVHAASEPEATRHLDEAAAWFAERTVVLPLAPTMAELRALNLRGSVAEMMIPR